MSKLKDYFITEDSSQGFPYQYKVYKENLDNLVKVKESKYETITYYEEECNSIEEVIGRKIMLHGFRKERFKAHIAQN